MTALMWLREAVATARAHRVHSAVTGLVAALVTAGLLVLVGQAHHQNRIVLDSFNRPEFRTVTLSDTTGTALDWRLADQVGSLSGLETAWVVGDAFEVTNLHLPGEARVSARTIAGDLATLPITLISGRLPAGPAEALVDAAGAATLGLDDSGGAVEAASGRSWAVVGVYAPQHERAPQAVLVAPAAGASVRSLTVVVNDARQLDATLAEVTSVVGSRDLKISGGAPVGDLAAQLGRDVGDGMATTIAGVLAAGLLVVGLLAALTVRTRAPEFGRRRALGASRRGLVGLVLTQGLAVVTPAAVVGAAAGTSIDLVAYGWLVSPPLAWWLVAVLVLGSCVAQLPSAAAAALRDPVRVLRTP